MADLYPVTDDDLSEAELTNYIDFSNLTNYFETDCAYTPDHTNEEVTVNSGKAYVRDTSGDTYALEPDQATIAFPNQTGVNYLYLTFDPTASPPESSVTWEISATDGGPADPKLKRAEIDASADSDTSFNDAPDTVVGDLTVNGTASGVGGLTTTTVTSNATTSGEDLIAVDTSGGPVTITLASSDVTNGNSILIVHVDGSNAITVDTEASETIDPNADSSKTINNAGDSVRFTSDGADWDSSLAPEYDSVTTEQIGNERHYAGAYAGADADARLDAALSAASIGDTIYLEGDSYTSDRTINTQVGIIGTGSFVGSGVGNPVIDATWTLSARVYLSNVVIAGTIDMSGRSALSEASSGTVTISANSCAVLNSRSVSVTFESGTSDGMADALWGSSSVTDNGSNTVGDIT